MDVDSSAKNIFYKYGKGKILIERKNPKELVLTPHADSSFMHHVKKAFENEANAGKLITKNYFYLERGPYDIISVMTESVSDEPHQIKGPVIDMFDPMLPVLTEKTINPGQQSLLYDLKRLKNKKVPAVLCAASRIYDEKKERHHYSFITKSPSGTHNVMRIFFPKKPLSVTTKDAVGNIIENKASWDELSHTLLLQFINSADGIRVLIK
jgi:hypothetical protein